MLGRLRMPIDDAIDCYEKLSKRIFQSNGFFGAATFSHEELESAFKAIIEDMLENEHANMLDDQENNCKT